MSPPRKRQRTTFATTDRASDEDSAYDVESASESASENASESEDPETTRRLVEDEADHMTILKTLYGGGNGIVAITFGDEPDTFDFPTGLLTSNFEYFRRALRTQTDTSEAVFAEGEKQQVHFEDIDVGTFATLHRWVSERAIYGADHRTAYWYRASIADRNVVHLLQVAVAADYLGLDHFAELEAWLNQGFALTVLMDRRKVTQSVLELVRGHDAFRSGLFWRTIIKAGVRPALQEHMLATCDGLHMLPEWEKTLKHCRKLRRRRRNAEYAAAVLEEITATLMDGAQRGQQTGLGVDDALVYRDPLREVYELEIYRADGEAAYDFTL